jgi:site-specific DNA-methyltransferase (adenine-specific)
MSESIAKLWKDTSDDLLTVASKFTIETASRLIIGLRTFRSFLAQTTSKGIGNLCPEFLPIIVAMKPCEGTFTENALKWGVAGLAIDAGRIQSGPSAGGSISGASAFGQGFGWNEHANRTTQIDRNAPDRWPANVILDEEAGEMLDRQSGDRSSPWIGNPNTTGHKGGKMFGGSEQGEQADQKPEYRDSGGASRFFYCAKASRSERGEGNTHPCVKPIKLCEYLAKLLLPPKRDDARRLLVPFSGSGSEMIGALRAGWDEVVGIESNPEYVAIAERRIAGEAPLFADDGELR